MVLFDSACRQHLFLLDHSHLPIDEHLHQLFTRVVIRGRAGLISQEQVGVELGGFQAGVIFGAAFVLFALIFGLDTARRVAPPSVVDTLIALGLLLYAGTGVVTMLRGGNYLHYDWLDPHYTEADALDGLRSVHGQHWGIFAVELGVGLTVAAGMITIYFSFAGHRHRDS